MRYDKNEYEYEYENDTDFSEDNEDDELDTVPCPYCGAEIYAEADVCPECGSFVFPEEIRTRKPNWILWTAWLLIFVFAVFFLLGIFY